MLRIQPIRNSLEALKLLESFDPESTTWVVSDLKSKLDINRRLLRERGFVPGFAVWRASELWKSLLTRTRADLQIVSREFMLTFIADRLGSLAGRAGVADGPGVPQTVFDYMTQLMPVLSHPSGEEIMTEWFSRNEASKVRWGRWFELSVRVWGLALDEGFLAAPWVSGVLVNEPSLRDVWSRPLVVDLGADLTQVEADLLLVLGDHLDVTVLKPTPSWASEYSRTLQAYEVLEAKLGIARATAVEADAAAAPSVAFKKYTTMIAEVKDATAQVRRWLDSGVAATDIAVVAPDIEPYWFALSNYLEVEGIPAQKDRVRRLHSFPDIAQWLAQLRLKTGGFDQTDLELAVYGGSAFERKLISYDEFKTVYAAIYGREDLARRSKISAAFEIELEPSSIVARDAFVAWSLTQLPSGIDVERVETGLKRVISEVPESLSLPVRRWMTYLEQVLSRVEVLIGRGSADGIACLRLSSAENSPARYMILLGLTESALKKQLSTSILFSDLWSLGQEFGFHLAADDQAQLEFETRWLIDAGERTLVLSVPETDFDGAAQAPSWLWVKGSREAGQGTHVTLPGATRWDEIQKGSLEVIARERGWRATDVVEQALREDFHEAEIPPFAEGFVDSLSPSRIEAYLECPFIFAAKYMFRLADDSELDLEVDALRRGSLMHAVFEELTVEPMKYDLSDAELGDVVERARRESKIELADERLWAPLKARHIDLGRRFLQFEREYRAQFGDVRTVAREFKVEGFLDPATGALSSSGGEGLLAFNGRIDRIDQDSDGHLAIFDYKSSGFGLSQFGSWIKNNKVQLLLYSLAIEKGLTALEARNVFAALYYVARPFSRDTGFMVEGEEQGLYAITNKRKRNRLSVEAKDELFREGEKLIREAVAGMRAGLFAPRPRDPKRCLTCKWSSLCRTPHLNS